MEAQTVGAEDILLRSCHTATCCTRLSHCRLPHCRLQDNYKLRPPPSEGSPPTRVVISGAGPVGLRAAVEAALNGMSVTVLEKRDVFS